MLSVEQAHQLMLGAIPTSLPPADLELAPELLGGVLAEAVACDVDMPPFDKALMDGVAVRCSDGAGVRLIVEEITAGRTPTRPVEAGQAARIMTGAPIPDGADAVIAGERCEFLAQNRVQLQQAPKPGQNIMRRAAEMRRGEVVLPAGTVLRPQECGILASVGRSRVQVLPTPSAAIVSTGDELVDVQAMPGPGQIRNSNATLVWALALRAGARATRLAIAPDRRDDLRERIDEGLRHDVLILSGGVSAGKLDLVPSVLAEAGVQAVFHKVAMKPGKPLFFGIVPRGDMPPRLVFGLPGNPVATLVCFELFVRSAIRRLRGLPAAPAMIEAAIDRDFAHAADRPTYHPARLRAQAGRLLVDLVPWLGSSDLRALTQANAFALLNEGEQTYRQGELLQVLVPEHPLD